MSAFACLLGFGVAGLITAIGFWKRPAAQLSGLGVKVCNWRTVLVPWGMISEATTSQDRPALLLADGQVMPLRFAETIPRAGEYQSAALDILDAALRGHRQKRHAARLQGVRVTLVSGLSSGAADATSPAPAPAAPAATAGLRRRGQLH